MPWAMRDAERDPGQRQHRGGVRRERDQAARDGVGPLGRRHSPEDADAVHPLGQRGARGERVGTTAGEADHAQGVDAETSHSSTRSPVQSRMSS